MNTVQIVNTFLSSLTLIGTFIIIGFTFFHFFTRFQNKNVLQYHFFSFVKVNALRFGLIISLIAMLGSLFFSDIALFAPCVLCWYQRILMYPQVLLFSVALFKKNRDIADYSLALSIPGAVIALYHYFLQTTKIEILPCSTVGYSVSCTETFTKTFGFVTIPFMALTAFILLIILMICFKVEKKK